MNNRLVLEGLQVQGPDEEISYRIEATPAAISVVNVTVHDLATGEDVTATVMPGAASAVVAGGAIVVPVLKALTAGHTYIVRALYSDGSGNKLEPLIQVRCV